MTAADRLRRAIFGRCKRLGLHDDARHKLQEDVTGKTSLTEMTEGELHAVLTRLGRQPIRTPLGFARSLLADTEDGQARLDAFARKKFGKSPADCNANEQRGLVGFARRIEGAPARAFGHARNLAATPPSSARGTRAGNRTSIGSGSVDKTPQNAAHAAGPNPTGEKTGIGP